MLEEGSAYRVEAVEAVEAVEPKSKPKSQYVSARSDLSMANLLPAIRAVRAAVGELELVISVVCSEEREGAVDRAGGQEIVKSIVSKRAWEREEWEEGFREEFWPMYPRKGGKPAALRAWRGLRPGKLDEQSSTLEAICSGVERWLVYWRENEVQERMIPHPATFLNQRRHEDYPS